MKKIVVLMLALLTLCSFSVASATSYVIQFRGATWGLGLDAVQQSLVANMPAANIETKEFYLIYPSCFASSPENEWVSTETYCGFVSSLTPSSSCNFSVGGYSVEEVVLEAHYGKNGNTISRELSDSVFYIGAYIINADDIKSAYFDLQGKLTYLYGEYEEFKHEKTYTTTWFGARDTAVSLACDGTEITIIYYKNNYDEKLAGIEKAVYKMYITEKYKDSDLTGL